ncbi:hypothetical protein BZG35_08430 [Brevundimonas sp. LM2]|uniref:TonB-dependent siderophore receptor n=1 Tax=Brevundimonas sp. LM2 TaxID=1938605 RepID=UPI0009840502|nr:TonB-dependent receptor [Brevundimonas sp. LM2]AQR61674.1 hypothetical protein BZG35_08430 [Brevundimonas sp. LM2]
MTTFKKRLCLAGVALAALSIGLEAQARSVTVIQDQARRDFNVPAGPLSQTALTLSDQAGVQLVFDAGASSGVRGGAVRGSLTVDQAMDQLLAGTGLSWRYLREGVVTIEAAVQAGSVNGERVLGPVRVEGLTGTSRQGRTSGPVAFAETDSGITEDRDTYAAPRASIGVKSERDRTDIPQTVSVITRAELDDRRVDSLDEALQQAPGLTTRDLGRNTLAFTSRAFVVDAVSIDGGAALPRTQGGSVFSPDLSAFDRVELIRGPDGLFRGFGSPGGTINLVRKLATRDPRSTAVFSAERYGGYRAEIDISRPLRTESFLGLRTVAFVDREGFFNSPGSYDTSGVFATATYEPLPSVRFTGGASFSASTTEQPPLLVSRFEDGTELPFPRDENFASDWSSAEQDSLEFFANASFRHSRAFNVEARLSRREVDKGLSKNSLLFGPVNPITGEYQFYGSTFSPPEQQTQNLIDLFVSGLLGSTWQIEYTVGGNYSRSYYDRSPIYYDSDAIYFPGGPLPADLNFRRFDPNDIPEPQEQGPLFIDVPLDEVRQTGLYGYARVASPFGLKVSLGGRVSDYRTVRRDRQFGRDGTLLSDRLSNVRRTDSVFTPYAALQWDLSETLSSYLSYTDIFTDQSTLFDRSGNPLPPVEGDNFETGLKGNLTPSLTWSAALYRINLENQASFLPPPRNCRPTGTSSCAEAERSSLSQGIDIELSGALTEAWEISLSYVYNENRRDGGFTEAEQVRFETLEPRHNFKFATQYRTTLRGRPLSLGLNGRFRSEQYVEGSAGADYDPVTGFATRFIPFRFVEDAHAIVDGVAQWEFAPGATVQLNVDNLLDETYFQTVGDTSTGNAYGKPRSWSLTLRKRW